MTKEIINECEIPHVSSEEDNKHLIIGTGKIEKVYYIDGSLDYLSYADLEDPGYEYREYSSGTKEWFRNGQYHRDGDEPAVIRPNGTKYWYKNGELHRDGDEPAVILADGHKEWWKKGKLHRDGKKPAKIYSDGSEQWWIDGMRIK